MRIKRKEIVTGGKCSDSITGWDRRKSLALPRKRIRLLGYEFGVTRC